MTKKNHHLRTIAQLCRAVSLQLRHVSTIRKNFLKSSMSSTCPHNVANFGPLTAEIGSRVSGSPANFSGFRILPSLLQQCHSPEANQTFHDVWPYPGWYIIYTFSGGSCTLTEFCQVQNSPLHPCLAFFYIGSVTARHCRSGRKPNFAAWHKEWNYGTFAEGATYIRQGGHHVGHRPTF